MAIHIAIIDQNKIFRESLKTLLEQVEGFNVVLEADDCECLKDIQMGDVDVIMIDFNMDNGTGNAFNNKASDNKGESRLLKLAMFTEDLRLNSGNRNVILKSSSKKQFEIRIRELVLEKDMYRTN